MFLRTLFYCLPAVLIGITLWAVSQVKTSRELRQGDLVALLPERQTPGLNPFQPKTEAERQLADLIYEPLVRLGDDGRPSPGLAGNWQWLKRVTVWFADTPSASAASQRLQETQSRWQDWQLRSARSDGRSLELVFTDPLLGALRTTLQAASARVQAVTIVRIQARGLAPKAHLAIVANPTLSGPVQRWWFNGDDELELAVAAASPTYVPELQRHLQRSLPENAELQVQVASSQPVLEEPILEFTLRDNARWHDGTTVTGADVRATWEAISSCNGILLNAESLRTVRAVESPSPNIVHVVLWRHYGPALCTWMGLPILSAEWLKHHPLDDTGRVFRDFLPLGTGPFRVEHRDKNSLVVRPVSTTNAAVHRLSLVTSLSGSSSELGYRTGALDLFWPYATALPQATGDEPLMRRATPAREMIQVVFNTRRDPLQSAEVRRALALAVDRKRLVLSAVPGAGTPHSSLFGPGLWLSDQQSVPEANPKSAEQALAEAGWLRTAQGTATSTTGALVFKLLTCSDDANLMRLASALRQQWQQLGVQIVVQSQPRSKVLALMNQGSFDAALINTTPPVTWDLSLAWHSQSHSNLTGYGNRPIDLLLEALAQEFDANEAALRTRRLENMILADSPVIPLLTLHALTVLRAGLAHQSEGATSVPWTLRSLLVDP